MNGAEARATSVFSFCVMMFASAIARTLRLSASASARARRSLLSEGRACLLGSIAVGRTIGLSGNDDVAFFEFDVACHDLGRTTVGNADAHDARFERLGRSQNPNDLNLHLSTATATAASSAGR